MVRNCQDLTYPRSAASFKRPRFMVCNVGGIHLCKLFQQESAVCVPANAPEALRVNCCFRCETCLHLIFLARRSFATFGHALAPSLNSVAPRQTREKILASVLCMCVFLSIYALKVCMLCNDVLGLITATHAPRPEGHHDSLPPKCCILILYTCYSPLPLRNQQPSPWLRDATGEATPACNLSQQKVSARLRMPTDPAPLQQHKGPFQALPTQFRATDLRGHTVQRRIESKRQGGTHPKTAEELSRNPPNQQHNRRLRACFNKIA